MPKSWSDKDERMYQDVKESSEQRGADEDRAEEVASRTVNKHRRSEGRPENKRTQGTGNPNRPLDKRSVQELRNRARELDIAGRSTMRKGDLVKAIRKHS